MVNVPLGKYKKDMQDQGDTRSSHDKINQSGCTYWGMCVFGYRYNCFFFRLRGQDNLVVFVTGVFGVEAKLSFCCGFIGGPCVLPERREDLNVD